MEDRNAMSQHVNDISDIGDDDDEKPDKEDKNETESDLSSTFHDLLTMQPIKMELFRNYLIWSKDQDVERV